MALRLDDITIWDEERERIRPHVERLEAFVRQFDTHARFHLRIGHDPELWELDAYIQPDLVDDPDLGDQLAELETDILLDYAAAIVVIRAPRPEPA